MNADIWHAIHEIHTWLHTVGTDLKDQHTFVDAYCVKVRQAGLPVDRFFCSAAVLHPLVQHKAWKWIDGHITDFNFTRAAAKEFSVQLGDVISGKNSCFVCDLFRQEQSL